MKYLKTLPITAAEAINRNAWNRRNPNLATLQADLHVNPPHQNCTGYDKPNVTEFLCAMVTDEAGDQAEIHVPDDHAQYFTAAERAQMSNVATLEVAE